MAIVKNSRTLLASQSLAAGGSVNASELNLSTAAGAEVFVKLTNGASAPTTAPTVTFYAGEATGVKRKKYTATGDTVGSSVTDIPCRYSLPNMFANVTIMNGATNAITVEVYAQEATSL
jgi:hypothetical protein